MPDRHFDWFSLNLLVNKLDSQHLIEEASLQAACVSGNQMFMITTELEGNFSDLVSSILQVKLLLELR